MARLAFRRRRSREETESSLEDDDDRFRRLRRGLRLLDLRRLAGGDFTSSPESPPNDVIKQTFEVNSFSQIRGYSDVRAVDSRDTAAIFFITSSQAIRIVKKTSRFSSFRAQDSLCLCGQATAIANWIFPEAAWLAVCLRSRQGRLRRREDP